MLKFAALAAVGALSAAGAAQTVVMLDRAGHPHELRNTETAMAATRASDAGVPPASGQAGEVAKAADGHFWAQAEVKLASISVAGAKVDDVDALVIEKGLPSSLLGMTYLGRLSTFEATKTALILRP